MVLGIMNWKLKLQRQFKIFWISIDHADSEQKRAETCVKGPEYYGETLQFHDSFIHTYTVIKVLQ